MPLDKKVDAIAFEISEKVVAELERIRMITEGRDSTFTQALREAIPRVRVKVVRWCEQVTNQHPSVEKVEAEPSHIMDTTAPPKEVTSNTAAIAAEVVTAESSFEVLQFTPTEVENLFISARDYTVKTAADFAVPVAVFPLVNKLFNLIISGAGKYIKPEGNYQRGDAENIKDVFERVLDTVKERYGLDEPLIPASERLL